MAATVPVKNVRTLIAAGTSVAAGTPNRGGVDLRSAFGGLLTIKVANGGTAPNTQATVNVLVAHNSGTLPTLASAGSTWKTIASFGVGVINSSVTEYSMNIDASVMHLEVEVIGNTGQPVTAEAFLSELTSPTT